MADTNQQHIWSWIDDETERNTQSGREIAACPLFLSRPALLMYEHGKGRVIATTMYSDWAYGHGQASGEEVGGRSC